MKTRTYLTIFVLLFCLSSLSNADNADLKVQRKVEPVRPEQIKKIGGFVGGRVLANKDSYLHIFDIDRHVREVEQKNWQQWSWVVGEQPGKWLESSALNSQYCSDILLEEKVRVILDRIAAAQEPSGYVGITDPAVRTKDKPLRGMDPYELYFMQHGLLTAYELLGEKKALVTASRLGDYFVNNIGQGKAEFWPSPYRPPENINKIICPQVTWVPEGTQRAANLYVHSDIAGHSAHYGWEGTLLIDPMMRLYEKTGDVRYLNWCKWVVSNIDKWSGWDAFSKLDQVAAGKMGIHELQPYVHAHTFQMNFLGFLRLYQVTGDESLFRKVTGAWDDIVSRQRYLTGGVSVGEHYEPGNNLPITGHVVETCATMSWIELTQYLLELTEDAKYADAIEMLLWNHLFAAQTIDGDNNRYHTALNGVKPAGYFHGPDCCTGSGHRIISKLPLMIYSYADDRILINQYIDSKAEFSIKDTKVTIEQITDFPESDKIFIKVNPDRLMLFRLKLRVPGWCKNPVIRINGIKSGNVTQGSFHQINRIWRAGDIVEVTLPMEFEWVKGDNTTEGMYALKRGPVVYALDTVDWDGKSLAKLGQVPDNIAERVGIAIEKAGEIETADVPLGTLGPGAWVNVELFNGEKLRVKMLPFANIGRWYRDPANKPEKNSASFAYAIWLYDSASEYFKNFVQDHLEFNKSGWRIGIGNWGFVNDGAVLAQKDIVSDCQVFLEKDLQADDYIIEVKGRKTAGVEAMLVLFRVKDDNNFYWWNIGGWQNVSSAIEKETDGVRTVYDRKDLKIETGRWYDITIAVIGDEIKCYLDGKLIHDIKDSTYRSGGISLGSWLASVEYKDLKVVNLQGKVLYQGFKN